MRSIKAYCWIKVNMYFGKINKYRLLLAIMHQYGITTCEPSVLCKFHTFVNMPSSWNCLCESATVIESPSCKK